MKATFRKLRKDYTQGQLCEENMELSPYLQFAKWMKTAESQGLIEPNAMVLATASKNGRPSQRVVLLKEFSRDGFVFYTNYSSRKGNELKINPNASLLFYWPELECQIRIEGKVKKVSPYKSDKYFTSRPLEARVSAAVSPQSETISREELQSRWKIARDSAEHAPPLRPATWGGYILVPDYFEFWQGRVSRLHDRISYQKAGRAWTMKRLAP